MANARQATTAISIRLPDTLLAELKSLATRLDVPYQSLIKMYLFERVNAERASKQRVQRIGTRKLKSSK